MVAIAIPRAPGFPHQAPRTVSWPSLPVEFTSHAVKTASPDDLIVSVVSLKCVLFRVLPSCWADAIRLREFLLHDGANDCKGRWFALRAPCRFPDVRHL